MKQACIAKLAIIALVISLSPAASFAADKIKLGPDGYGKTTLSNGIVLIVNRDQSTSLSAARIVIGGGILTETAADNGINNLMISLLLKGNADMTADQINERLDYLGASVSVECNRDFSAISLMALTENFDSALAVVSKCVLAPTFPQDELEKLKTEVEGDIKAANDSQSQSSSNLFWKTVFGDQGYGLPTLGTVESISKLTSADLKALYQKYAGGKNVTIGVATDLSPDATLAAIEKYFGALKADCAPIPAMTVKRLTDKEGFIPFDRNQSYIFMGFVLDRQDARSIAYLNILNQVMGANVGSRLWDLRQKEKLAYEVYTQWGPSRYCTIFRAAIGCDTSKVKLALASITREWSRLLADGITADEFLDARTSMKNQLIFGIDRKAGRANRMADYEYLGYGYHFVPDLIALADQIRLAEVNNFVKAKLSPDREYTSIVGKK